MEEQKKVRKRTTSSIVRNKWNANHYDRINVTIPKGYKAMFEEFCEERGTTMNSLLRASIKFAIDQYQAKAQKT